MIDMDPIAELSTAVDFWKAARLWVGIPTLALAAATFATQWMELKRSRALASLQREQLRMKDEQLRLELKEKDTKIASANQNSAEANQQAAVANENTAKLRIKAEETSILLEKEKANRLELEKAISPRVIEQYKFSQALKGFTGVTAIITSIPDFEAKRMAGQLATVLNMANWKYELAPFDANEIYPDGVAIERNVGAKPTDDRSSQAADLLLAQLRSNNIETRTIAAIKLPPNTIIIRIGCKPATFFYEKLNVDGSMKIFGNVEHHK